MKTRCDSVGIHEHYLLNLYVSTTPLVKSSTHASKVYSTTDCSWSCLYALVIASRSDLVCASFKFWARLSCRVFLSTALSPACITCQLPVLYFNHTTYIFVRKRDLIIRLGSMTSVAALFNSPSGYSMLFPRPVLTRCLSSPTLIF